MVLKRPRTLERCEFELPVVGADDARLRVEACGLCGTDHEQYSGHLFGGFEFIPGHESIGVIDAIGDEASARWGVAAGDRVAVEVFQSCRTCPQCLAGTYRHCRNHGLRDMYGFIPIDRQPALWGGYAEYQYLSPDSMLLKVPDNLEPAIATMFNPLGAGIRWGATVPGTGSGDVVAVLGPGIRGLCASVAAREAGAAFVMVTGCGERDHSRLDTAKEFGADLVVDVSESDPVEALRRAAGQAADIVIDVTAKAPAALAQAISLARPGGTVVVAGTRGSNETPGFIPDLIVYKELRVLGALGVDVTAYRAAFDLLASQKYPFAEVSRQIVGFDHLEGLLEMMADGTSEIARSMECSSPMDLWQVADMTDGRSEGRILRLSREEATTAALEAGIPEYMCDLNIFRVLLRHPKLARAVNDLLVEMIFRGQLDARLRELIIMRVAWRTGSDYEWAQHWGIATQFGVSEDDLVGVRDWQQHKAFGDVERAVLAAVDEALADGRISTSTWSRCEQHIADPKARLELITAIGAWQMISTLLRTLEVPLEDHLYPWPPDGTSPIHADLR
jgi:alcohol dehydrogenase